MAEKKMVPTFGMLQDWDEWPPQADPVPWPWMDRILDTLDKKQLVRLTNLRIKVMQQQLKVRLEYTQQMVQIKQDFYAELPRILG